MNSTITPLPFDRLPRSAPPGARGGAALPRGQRRHLVPAGQARARAHLLDFAERCEASQPELAKELRSAGNRMLMG